jgi:hypothetical protein
MDEATPHVERLDFSVGDGVLAGIISGPALQPLSDFAAHEAALTRAIESCGAARRARATSGSVRPG